MKLLMEFPAHTWARNDHTEGQTCKLLKEPLLEYLTQQMKNFCLFMSATEGPGRKGLCQLSSRQSLRDENAAMYALNKLQPAENV